MLLSAVVVPFKTRNQSSQTSRVGNPTKQYPPHQLGIKMQHPTTTTGKGQGRKDLRIMPTAREPLITPAVTIPIRIMAIVIRKRLSHRVPF